MKRRPMAIKGTPSVPFSLRAKKPATPPPLWLRLAEYAAGAASAIALVVVLGHVGAGFLGEPDPFYDRPRTAAKEGVE